MKTQINCSIDIELKDWLDHNSGVKPSILLAKAIEALIKKEK